MSSVKQPLANLFQGTYVFSMEYACTYPKVVPMVESILSKAFYAGDTLATSIAESSKKRLDASRTMHIVAGVQEICNEIHFVESLIDCPFDSDAGLVCKIRILHMFRGLLFRMLKLRETVKISPCLNRSQFLQLKVVIMNLTHFTERADNAIAAECGFPLSKSSAKRTVGDFALDAPLRVYMCDDDTGKHVSCFEIPQVYGFGETPEEAMDMLDREILSMRQDLNDGTPLSGEYEELRKMFSRMFKE